MVNFILLYFITIIGVLFAEDENHDMCKDKAFSEVCNIMLEMKRNMDESNTHMRERFGEIKKMFGTLKEEKETKSLIEKRGRCTVKDTRCWYQNSNKRDGEKSGYIFPNVKI